MNKVQDIAMPSVAVGAMDLLAPPESLEGDRKKSLVSTGPMGESLIFCSFLIFLLKKMPSSF